MAKTIYLDYASATPVAKEVMAVMEPYFSLDFQNPSGLTLASHKVKQAVDEARAQVAKCLGSRSQEIIFTAGGTESTNLAIHGVMRAFGDKKLLVSAVEHPAVLEPAKQYNNKIIPVDKQGIIDIEALREAIDDQTVLVSVMLVNNEIGTIQPLKNISRIIETVRADRHGRKISLPLYLHTDACQAGAYLDLHVGRLGVDMMTLNGGKMYGPKQSGILYCKTGVVLQPLIVGGGQEFGYRSGTQNVANIIGFASALTQSQASREEEFLRQTNLRNRFIEQLKEIKGLTINGSRKHRVANNVHITIEGTDNERLLMQLDERGVQCAVGSACSASSDQPSHVLTAIGLSDEQARNSLRFSIGRPTTVKDIDQVISYLKAVLQQ